jgi:hypothetical protein
MAYTARQLVNRAYVLSGIVGANLQQVSGAQFTAGMYMLNALLALKTANTRLIPYFQTETITAIIGEEGYFVENLLMVETLTFNMGTVRFPMESLSRKQYFGTGRVDGINALPGTYHVEREKGGARIYVYFLPNSAYPLKLWGKFGLVDVDEDDDLETVYDQFYIEYLRYALASYICAENSTTLSPAKQKILDQYEETLTDISPLDLTVSKASTLSSNTGVNWPFINLSGGWIPS